MKTYIYILSLLPRYTDENAWSEKENDILEKHAARLARQKERGTVKYVGKTDLPISNTENFGLVVFESESDEMAELFAQSDPAVMNKLMTAKCLPFKQVY